MNSQLLDSDRLLLLLFAITAHFGYWFRPERARTDHWHVADDLLYGQLIKRKQGYRLTFTLTRMLWGSRSVFYHLLTDYGFNSTIQTAFIERVNLTIRRGVAPLMRKTWSLSQSPEHLLLHCEWWRTYYHFVRVHDSLQQPVLGLPRARILRTPAMAAGVTEQLWSLAQSPEHLLLHCKWWRSYYHFVRPHDSLQLPVPGLPKARILRTPAMAAGISNQLWSVGTILKMPLYPTRPG